MLQRIPAKQRVLFLILSVVLLGVGAFIALKIKKRSHPFSAPPVSATFIKKQFENKRLLFSELIDFENIKDRTISADRSVSGTKSCKLSLANEFGAVATKSLKEIKDLSLLREMHVELQCWIRTDVGGAQYMLAIENAEGKNVFQTSKPVACPKTYEWNTLEFVFNIEEKYLDAGNRIKLYVWNKSLREFYIDDVVISFYAASDKQVHTASRSNFLYDFESPDSAFLPQAQYIKAGLAHSGKTAFDLSNSDEYGPLVTKQFGDVGSQPAKRINTSIWVYPLSDNASVEIAVSLFDKNDKSYFWQGKNVEAALLPKNTWTKINAGIDLPADRASLNDVIQVIARNKGKTKLLFDDFEIVYDALRTPEGQSLEIEPAVFYENRFVEKRNVPPFRTIFLVKQKLHNETTHFMPTDDFLVGDFIKDKNSLDEIICMKEGSQGLFAYSPEEKQFKQVWENGNATDSLWNKNNNYYSGDFNDDKKTDVLWVDKKTKDWGIIDFDGKKWVIVSKGKDPQEEWLGKKELGNDPIITKSDILISGNFMNEKQTYLKLNTDWRFDLKLLEKDKDGYFIAGNVDFKGYQNDHNPKYYENIKLVPGHFISTTKTALVVVSANRNNKETKDKTNKGANPFPNTTAVYQFDE